MAAFSVGPANQGLRGLAVNLADTRLFVAAPERNLNGDLHIDSPEGVLVLNIDPKSPQYGQQLPGMIADPVSSSGDLEPFGMTAAIDPNSPTPDHDVIVVTDRQANAFGLAVIHNAGENSIDQMTVTYVPLGLVDPETQQPAGLIDPTTRQALPNAVNTLGFNNAQAVAILPANALADHPGSPAYAFVTGENFLGTSPSTTPDNGLAQGVPTGPDIAIARNPFGDPNDPDLTKRAMVVAVTRPIPNDSPDNLVLSADGQYLYVAYQNTGAVFVYDVDAMLDEIENPLNSPFLTEMSGSPSYNPTNLLNTPIDNLHDGQLTDNSAIDVKADYRLDIPFYGPPLYPEGTKDQPGYVAASSTVFRNINAGEAPIATGIAVPDPKNPGEYLNQSTDNRGLSIQVVKVQPGSPATTSASPAQSTASRTRSASSPACSPSTSMSPRCSR